MRREMSLYNPAASGVPFQQPVQKQMEFIGTTGGEGSVYVEQRARGKKRRRVTSDRRETAGIDTGVYDAVNTEQAVDNMIVDPAFWGAVFKTLSQNTDVAEEIRLDLEQQEKRIARSRESAMARVQQRTRSVADKSRDNGRGEDREEPIVSPRIGSDSPMEEEGSGNEVNDDLSSDRRFQTESLPNLYDFMARGVENLSHATTGVQRLDLLMDELDIGALWSARDVMISFGPLTRVLLRLFVGPYATDEENLIVRMLNLGVERATKNYGFEDFREPSNNDRPAAFTSTEPFYLTYRRRGRALRDFAAFRYMLEIAESMGRIGRKHKNDLILLYMTLTTPEVRLHRRWNTDDREHVIAFRDRVTGFAMATPSVIARPMSIEMHLDSVFGNVSTNTRLLERSLNAALNNRNRNNANGGAAVAREVESLLGNAQSLDLTPNEVVGGGSTLPANSRSYMSGKNEQSALKHMLESSVIVSIMAEEYRVFVAGAPASRCSGGGGGSSRNGTRVSKRTLNQVENSNRPSAYISSSRSVIFRRPIFFTFKPTSQAMANKEQ